MSTYESLFDEPQQAGIPLPLPDDHVSTWPFKGKKDSYIKVDTFMRNLYIGDDDDRKPWITNTEGRETEQWWMDRRIGDENLSPELGDHVTTPKSSAWQWVEIWRALNTYKVLASRLDPAPVAKLIDLLQGGPHAWAMFPNSLRDLLKDNERKIINSGLPWVGHSTANGSVELNSEFIPPFDQIQATYANGAKFFQEGAIGPMTMEAAFILASQFAGINWRDVGGRITPEDIRRGVFWISALLPPGGGNDTPIKEYRAKQTERVQGLRYYLRDALPDNNVEAGIVFGVDIEPDNPSPNRNIFIFAVHAIDARSRVYIPDNVPLINLSYIRYNTNIPWPSRCEDTTGRYTRFYGHAHAATMPYQTWMDWIGERHPGNPMPDYTQIGKHHFYLLTEDESETWPRKHYLTTTPQRPRMDMESGR